MSITRTDARRIALRRIERRAKSHGEGTKALAWWLTSFWEQRNARLHFQGVSEFKSL